jgi:hypothetical protein
MCGIQFPVFNLVDTLIQVEYFGVNFIDTYYRSGLYKFKELPAVLGSEAAGTIVSLPTDQDVLNNETYKQQDFVVGGKVAVVRPPSLYILLAQTLKTPLLRSPLSTRDVHFRSLEICLSCPLFDLDSSSISQSLARPHSRIFFRRGV